MVDLLLLTLKIFAGYVGSLGVLELDSILIYEFGDNSG